MKKRTHLIAFPLLAFCGGLVWLIGTGDIKRIGADGEREPAHVLPPLRVEWSGGTALAAPALPAMAARPRAQAETPGAATPSPGDSIILFSGTGGGLAYTARADDTLSELTAALYGTNSRANRDAVVDANPSLQADPDHVTIGRDYNSKAVSARCGQGFDVEADAVKDRCDGPRAMTPH